MGFDLHYVKFLIILVILASSLSYLVMSGLKLLFQVPRPCELIGTCPDSFSFPSRHTGIAFAVAAVVVLYTRSRAYSILAILLASLVGYWRLLVGVHTIYDILGGIAIGFVVGWVVYYFFKKHRGPNFRRK